LARNTAQEAPSPGADGVRVRLNSEGVNFRFQGFRNNSSVKFIRVNINHLVQQECACFVLAWAVLGRLSQEYRKVVTLSSSWCWRVRDAPRVGQLTPCATHAAVHARPATPCVDYNLARATEVQAKLGDDARFPVEKIDARKQADIEALARKYTVDIIINACDPSFNEPIFDASFAVGAKYMDMALTLSEPHETKPFEECHVKLGDYQFARADAWEKAGNLAIVGMGVEPGMSNVFAKYAATHLGLAEIDEIGVRDGSNIGAAWRTRSSVTRWTIRLRAADVCLCCSCVQLWMATLLHRTSVSGLCWRSASTPLLYLTTDASSARSRSQV
jgi:hypothetical protein